jgi:hypothetical protein
MPKNRSSSLIAAIALATLPFGDARAETKDVHYIDLTTNFSRFVDETAGMEEAARIAEFQKQMTPLLPGFYEPRLGATPERYNKKIGRALNGFADLRPKYEQVQRDFPAAFEAGIQHFRKAFPGFVPNVPVYLLHSAGEMDGGTRELRGKVYLIFGADVIAQIHDSHTLTPFLDHELFHVEHGKNFSECPEAWCALWAEGLATYAAKVMTRGADDRQLLLTSPKPIRAAVDATWPRAACVTRDKLDSSAESDINAMFSSGGEEGEFPERFGYYVGLRVAEESASQYSLAELAKMPPAQAKTVLTAALDRLIKKSGGCSKG